MNANSDPDYARYADLDFKDAKPVSAIPALARLQAEQGGTSEITVRIDNETLSTFRAYAEMTGGDCQALMHDALRHVPLGYSLADVVRETIRTELREKTRVG